MAKNLPAFLNFRDLGGLKTADGRQIKCKKLFRCAPLHPKTEEDRRFIENLNLDAVIDLRTEAEAKEIPDVLPDGVQYVSASVFNTPDALAIVPTKDTFFRLLRANNAEIARYKQNIYQSYKIMTRANYAYEEIFKRMDKGETIAFHCTAGKDRTGFGAFLVEYSLGRTLDDCRAEYLKSNEYRKPEIDYVKQRCKFAPIRKSLKEFFLFGAQTFDELFDTALDEIALRHPTVDDYLEAVFAITADRRALWQKLYLE